MKLGREGKTKIRGDGRGRMPILGAIGFFLFLILFGVAESGTEEKGVLMVDRFSGKVDEDGIPSGWALEGGLKDQSKISLEREQDDHFLRFSCAADNFGIKKDIKFDIRNYPYLSWRWKVTQLPRGGDIREKELDDEAGQIYVIFPRFPAMLNSLSVGYIWDSTAPVGLSGTSKAYSKMKYVVLQSGSAKLNQWVRETRNVYEDFKRLFQEEPPRAGAVLLYINSQHTKGTAECLYDDIFFSSSPPDISPK
jgi:hypothetical protein